MDPYIWPTSKNFHQFSADTWFNLSDLLGVMRERERESVCVCVCQGNVYCLCDFMIITYQTKNSFPVFRQLS